MQVGRQRGGGTLGKTCGCVCRAVGQCRCCPWLKFSLPHRSVAPRTNNEEVRKVEGLSGAPGESMRSTQAAEVGAAAQRGERCSRQYDARQPERTCLLFAAHCSFITQLAQARAVLQHEHKHRCAHQPQQGVRSHMDRPLIVSARWPAVYKQKPSVSLAERCCLATQLPNLMEVEQRSVPTGLGHTSSSPPAASITHHPLTLNHCGSMLHCPSGLAQAARVFCLRDASGLAGEGQ